MEKKNTTTRIILDLEDDEFIQLGGLGLTVDIWKDDPSKNAFGRLALKIKDQVEKKATPGQLAYLEKIVFAVQEAAYSDPASMDSFKDGVCGFAEAAENVFNDLQA